MIRQVFSMTALVAVLILATSCDVLASIATDTTPVTTPVSTSTTVSLVVTGLAGGNRTYAWTGDFGVDNWDNATRTFAVTSGTGTAAATRLVATGTDKMVEFSLVEAGTWNAPWYDAGQFGIDDNYFDALSNFAVSVPLDKKAHSIEITYLNHNFPQVTLDGAYAANLSYGLANRPSKVISLGADGTPRTNDFTFNSSSLQTWTREYGYAASGADAYNSTSPAYPVYFGAGPIQSVLTYNASGNLTTVVDTLPSPSVAGLYSSTTHNWSPGTVRDFSGWTAARKAAAGYYQRTLPPSAASPLVIPASALVLDDNLFDQVYGASGPTAIEFSAAGLTTIGAAAFANFPSLTSVTLPSTVTTIGDNAFADDVGVTSLTLGSGTKTIGGAAFAGMTGLTTVDVPGSVIFIDANAFSGDTAVTTLHLGTITGTHGIDEVSDSRLRVIGGAAFAGLAITEVILPASLLEIRGSNAFAGCSALDSVVIDGLMAEPPKMAAGSGTFGGLPATFKIWVPNALLSAFQAAPGWSDYADHVNGY